MAGDDFIVIAQKKELLKISDNLSLIMKDYAQRDLD